MATPDLAQLTPAGEAEWQRFRQAVEWARGFALIFLFADPVVAAAFRERLQSVQRFRTSDVEAQVLTDPDIAAAEVVERLQSPDERYRDLGAVWWIEMALSGEAWDTARKRVLARLNEQREQLRRNVDRPCVLVLPLGFSSHTAEAAPDLWSVRTLALHLSASEALQATGFTLAPLRDHRQASSGLGADVSNHPYVREWFRLRDLAAQSSDQPLDEVLAAGWRAADYALEMRSLAVAEEIAREVFALAEHSQEDGRATLRDFILSLSRLGDVAHARMDLAAAEASYRRCLELSEHMLRQIGETPEALRDVSISLERVGDVAWARGDLAAAEASYRRGLEVRERVLRAVGDTPEALRDVSISLNRVGDVALARGDLAAAEASYRRGLEVSERVLGEVGETPKALRDVSISLDRVGDVALARGDLAAAEASYRRGLEVRERLLREVGETPEALRDVSISLDRVGDVARVRGDLAAAEASYRRGLEVSERVLRAVGETPEALRDVSISLNRVGDVARVRGDLAAAGKAYRDSLDLTRRSIDAFGETALALEDLAHALVRLVNIEVGDDHESASEHLDEAQKIMIRLRRVSPDNQGYAKLAASIDALREHLVKSATEPLPPGAKL